MNRTVEYNLLNSLLLKQIIHILPTPGRIESIINGVALTRYDSSISPVQCLCYPMIAYVVQGNKRSFYGKVATSYGQGQCIVLGVDVPSTYHIEDASSERPFLSLSVKLDSQIISHLLSELPVVSESKAERADLLGIMEADMEILDNFRRLVDLLNHPEQIPLFARGVMEELHYFILKSKLGYLLRLYNTVGTRTWQIRCAIAWMRDHYKENFKIEEIASKANMSLSTFNRYFRKVTGLSPLQFQKHLRLHEAERLMLVENHDASSAAIAVGYESRSHFTREYKRLFGAAPGRDVRQKQLY